MHKLFTVEKYRVTHDFADSEIGEIRNVISLCDEGGAIMVYHPADDNIDSCGCFEICKRGKDGILVTHPNQSYVNADIYDLDGLFIKNTKKWKQEVIPAPKKKKKKRRHIS